MACLRIRLPPAKSVWKSLASKLLKLHRSKPIKKLAAQTVMRPIFRPRRRKSLVERRPRLNLKRPCLFKKKRKVVVYVDKLFREPTLPVEKTATIPKVRKQSSSSDVTNQRRAEADDEAWESMALASPLVRGIDDRAEEFIARIKAEMRFQERIINHAL